LSIKNILPNMIKRARVITLFILIALIISPISALANAVPLPNRPMERENQIFIDGIRVKDIIVTEDGEIFVQLREVADAAGFNIIHDSRQQLVNVYSGSNPPDIRREAVFFPAIVETSADRNTITKTYFISEYENPAEIITDDFVENGITYALVRMTREENPIMEGRMHTEVVQVELSTDDISAVLSALGDIIQFSDDFGFQGELRLRPETIRTEIAGHRNEGFTSRETRSFLNLPNNDIALIPRTISVNNQTYYLVDVQWTETRHDIVDYRTTASKFTANAIYTRQGTRRVTTGFLAIAEFTGEVNRYDWGMTRYVLIFEAVSVNNLSLEPVESISEPIREEPEPLAVPTPEPQPDQQPERNPFPWGRVFGFIGLGLLIVALVGGVVFIIYLLCNKFIGKNVTVYQVQDDGSYNVLTKMKLTAAMDTLDMNLLPIKVREKITQSKFIFELTDSARKKFESKTISVKLRGYSISEFVDPNLTMKKYQFQVDFELGQSEVSVKGGENDD